MAIMPLRARKPMLLMICIAIFGVLTTAIKEEVSTTAMGPVFVFGDSTMDVGTNNYLKNCTARADNPYYGIHYPGSVSTGRFSNGFNLADTMVPAGIYAKVHYGTSLSNVDWLHGGAESLLTLTNLFIVLGLRQALRKPKDATERIPDVVSEVPDDKTSST